MTLKKDLMFILGKAQTNACIFSTVEIWHFLVPVLAPCCVGADPI